MQDNLNDKFYTRNSLVKTCIDYVNSIINIDKKEDIIIEPSAGAGSFINSIKGICDNTIFYDIMPEHSEIVKQDYLTTDLSIYNKKIQLVPP